MQIKSIEVENIVIISVDAKTRTVSLQVNFSDKTSFPVTLTLNENFEEAVEKLLKHIKNSIRPETTEEVGDILSGISVVNIKNEEDVIEKAPKKLSMLDRKLDTFKNTKDHRNYMQIHSQLSTIREFIYKKN